MPRLPASILLLAFAALPGAAVAQGYGSPPYQNGPAIFPPPPPGAYQPDPREDFRREEFRREEFRREEERRRFEERRAYEERQDPRYGDRGGFDPRQQQSQGLLQQRVRDAQTRHNQGVVQLQQQFNQHQINRDQMNAGIRNLEATMNGEIAQAQREAQRR